MANKHNYEDNYGYYHIKDDPDELLFIKHIRSLSTPKKCKRCRKIVHLQEYKIRCASCTDAIECGAPKLIEN